MNLLNPIAAHLLPLVRAQNSRLYGTPNDVAGADVMADRFQAGDAAIASGPKLQVMDLPASRRALATFRHQTPFRHQTLVTELSAIADVAAPAPDQPRARRRL
ncbi:MULTISPECIES: hypothetical protein [Burkholderia]|uniref:hypothetical protein n=1 Tax=Burkholderia TaxID=32008 RepID=UPI001640B4CE|nr:MULTISPECIES: hypothetical protein [Burkholderia]